MASFRTQACFCGAARSPRGCEGEWCACSWCARGWEVCDECGAGAGQEGVCACTSAYPWG